MGWEYYQTVDPLEKEPQSCRGLFGVRLLILHFKFEFSKSIKSSTFHIFLNLTYSLRKKFSFTKCPKTTQKFTQNRKTLVNVLSGAIWRCLKRERDFGTKATLSEVKTAFRWNPALIFNILILLLISVVIHAELTMDDLSSETYFVKYKIWSLGKNKIKISDNINA